jgi:predicted ATP-dependent endonuclease of OLD family
VIQLNINFVEVQNFRKLKSAHIAFDVQTTLFVGANNSGKTSAMLALRYFLSSAKAHEPKLTFRDITIENWTKIDQIGMAWETNAGSVDELAKLLPALDVWLDVPLAEIHHVVHVLPTIDWNGGPLGVRLQYQPKNIEQLRIDFLTARARASDAAQTVLEDGKANSLKHWPDSLTDFLVKRMHGLCEIEAYPLDPEMKVNPQHGVAFPQVLDEDTPPLAKNPFQSLIRIDRIDAQREFSDAGGQNSKGLDDDGNDIGGRSYKRKLSVQLREYYDRHVSPNNDEKALNVDDINALISIQDAEKSFDKRLKDGFSSAFGELEELGYPGISNPKLSINTQLRATDGLRHGSALQYEIADPSGNGSKPLRLPDDYSGLGYQNLISMTFMLMGFRDDWLRVGQPTAVSSGDVDAKIPPLHLVLVEEPEAHLHA